MHKYKLIALDLDGTLLNTSKEISDQNLHWIRQAEEAGLIVSFATGRGRNSSEPFWGAVSPKAPMVMTNGAEIWKNHDEVLSRHALPDEYVPRLIELAQEHGAQYWTVGDCTVEGNLGTGDCLKVGMYHHDLRIIDGLRDLVTTVGDFEVSSSARNNIELNRKGVTKAAGLSEVIGPLGIKPSEVVAIGDGLNDLAMLRWAGFSVAMQNAPDIVKEHADHITASNDEDGVAQLIQLLLKQMS